MRTEADEVADAMRPLWKLRTRALDSARFPSVDLARAFVREHMPGESNQVIDNVAESLVRGSHGQEA